MIKSGSENNCGIRVIPGPITNSLFSLNTSNTKRRRVRKLTGVDAFADVSSCVIVLVSKIAALRVFILFLATTQLIVIVQQKLINSGKIEFTIERMR